MPRSPAGSGRNRYAWGCIFRSCKRGGNGPPSAGTGLRLTSSEYWIYKQSQGKWEFTLPLGGHSAFPRERRPRNGNKKPRSTSMIGYVTIGTNDLVRAAAFYDALLGEVGAKRMMETEQFIAWSVRPGSPGLGVTKPFDKKPATVGNGVMVA